MTLFCVTPLQTVTKLSVSYSNRSRVWAVGDFVSSHTITNYGDVGWTPLIFLVQLWVTEGVIAAVQHIRLAYTGSSVTIWFVSSCVYSVIGWLTHQRRPSFTVIYSQRLNPVVNDEFFYTMLIYYSILLFYYSILIYIISYSIIIYYYHILLYIIFLNSIICYFTYITYIFYCILICS